MSAERNLAFSKTVAEKLGCSSPADLPCLQKLPLATLYATGKQMRFAPAMPKEGDYPLGKSSLRSSAWLAATQGSRAWPQPRARPRCENSRSFPGSGQHLT